VLRHCCALCVFSLFSNISLTALTLLRGPQRATPGFGSAAAATPASSWFPTLAIAANGIALVSSASGAAGRSSGSAARHTLLSAGGAGGIGLLEPGWSNGTRRARPGTLPLQSSLTRSSEGKGRMKAQVLFAAPLRRTLVVGTESGEIKLCT
jgi:hypothetical protein